MSEYEVTSLRARVEAVESEIESLQSRYDALLAEFGQNIEVPLSLGLTKNEAGILGALMSRQMATKSTLMVVLYDHRVTDKEVPEEKIIDVFVCHLRKKLEQHDITVETVWGIGYKLSPEAKQKILQMMRDEGLDHSNLKVAV